MQTERKPLDEIYSFRFFRGRHKLHWRAKHFCSVLVNTFEVKRVIDVGCATGDIVHQLNLMGVDAWGIEGSMSASNYMVTDKIIWHDMRDALQVNEWFESYDLCLCLEVAEHIESEYADVLVDNLCFLSPKILMSAAPPGQGHGHRCAAGKNKTGR